jgi:hypothetical protein
LHKFTQNQRFRDPGDPKPYKFIGFGDLHGPKPYKFVTVMAGGGGVGGVEAGFGGPVRSLRPLLWAYGPKNPSPRAPPLDGALRERLLGPYTHRRGFRDQTGPPKPASSPNFATTHVAPAHEDYKTFYKESIQVGCVWRVLLRISNGRVSGYLKAVWPDISGSVFSRFSARRGPRTPLDRRSSSCSAACTKNQPGRPILRPLRGANKFRQDCLHVIQILESSKNFRGIFDPGRFRASSWRLVLRWARSKSSRHFRGMFDPGRFRAFSCVSDRCLAFSCVLCSFRLFPGLVVCSMVFERFRCVFSCVALCVWSILVHVLGCSCLFNSFR